MVTGSVMCEQVTEGVSRLLAQGRCRGRYSIRGHHGRKGNAVIHCQACLLLMSHGPFIFENVKLRHRQMFSLWIQTASRRRPRFLPV